MKISNPLAKKATPPRIIREVRTIRVMIRLWCKTHHSGRNQILGKNRFTLCESCANLTQYAMDKLIDCTHQEEKPTCLKCPTPCHSSLRKAELKEVMRWAGPKMTYRHPMLAWLHLWDGWFKKGKNKVKRLRRKAEIEQS